MLKCDFCGQVDEKVRRIALDTGYDRVTDPKHVPLWACWDCSQKKEEQRNGLHNRASSIYPKRNR